MATELSSIGLNKIAIWSDAPSIYYSESSFSKGKKMEMGSGEGSGSGKLIRALGILSPMGPPFFPYLLFRLDIGSGGSSRCVGWIEATDSICCFFMDGLLGCGSEEGPCDSISLSYIGSTPSWSSAG